MQSKLKQQSFYNCIQFLKSFALRLMFYIVQNLKSELLFSPYDMDKLSSDQQILKRLRERVQGRCHAEYGYIIQLLNSSGNDKKSYEISVPSIQENGCKVNINFSAITFKAQKNDIIDIIVSQIHQEYIKGAYSKNKNGLNMPVQKGIKYLDDSKPGLQLSYIKRYKSTMQMFLDKNRDELSDENCCINGQKHDNPFPLLNKIINKN